MDTEIFHVDHDHASARCGDVLVIVWRGTTTKVAVQRLRERLASLGKARHAGIGLLTIVEAGAVLPSNEARDHLARMLREAHQVRASAVCFEGDGFRAAAVRGVVAGLTMLARQPFPHKVFSTLELAGAWLVPALREKAAMSIDVPELVTAVRQVREEIARRVPAGGAG